MLQRLEETEMDRDRLLAELEEQDKQVPEWEWFIYLSVSEDSSEWLIGSSRLAAQPVNLFFLSTQPYLFLSLPGPAQYTVSHENFPQLHLSRSATGFSLLYFEAWAFPVILSICQQ